MSTPLREESLFQAAVELPSAERAAFLDRQCTGRPALRARLEALLHAHDQPETVFGTRAGEAGPTIALDLADDLADDGVGRTIGPYKLRERIGEGGCGVVYVAEQTEPLRRRVALKLIKLGMDTKQVVARFEAERQALAMMDHPNIAKVLDAGTTGGGKSEIRNPKSETSSKSEITNHKSEIPSGRPYFVMELVRGIKITDYCDQERLSTRERLDLFIKVCHAIQHAHQKGIIHRDIKPSNILVTLHDGVPVPKVIDFGIAKATEGRLTDATVYTQLHQFIGTPAYMSPEQAEMSGLDIDTRSDIYSLGVLLYELLTGSTPFDAKELMSQGLDAMRRTIREKEPLRPSTRLTQTRAATAAKSEIRNPKSEIEEDLDWIVMKCLEKDRTRRYETANGLAADLKRHLTSEPVLARPPSAAYRLQKAWRRHKLAFTTASAIVAALVIAVVALTFAWARERTSRVAQREQAEAERTARTEAARAEAIASFVVNLLDRSVGTMSREGNMRGMRSLFEAADAVTAARLTPSPEAELTVRATLWRYYARILNEQHAAARQGDRIRELLPAFAGRELTLPGFAPAASAHEPVPLQDYLRLHTIGSHLWAGETEWARRQLASLRAEFLGRTPQATNSLALALSTEGFCLHAMDLDHEAEPLLREAFALAPDLTGFFVSDQPGLTYGQTLIALGKVAEAESVLVRTLPRISPQEHLSALNGYSTLLESLCLQGRFEAAEDMALNVVRLSKGGPTSGGEALPMDLLALAVKAQAGQWREAAATFSRLAADSTAPASAWRIGAAAALSLGDLDGYRGLCRQAIWRFGATAESESALFLAMGLLLGPADGETLFALRTLAARLEEVREEHWSGAFHRLVRALLDYRAGNPAAALRHLEAWEASRDPYPVRAVLLRHEQASPAPAFWRAMMLAELGRPEEAAAAFAEGRRRLGAGPVPGWDLLQRTAALYVAQALHLQAQQVLQGHSIAVQ